MNGWKPIHTAPRDGTLVLCWVEQRPGYCEETGDIPDDEGGHMLIYFEGGEWRFLYGDEDAIEYGPTHWMPLPPPPGR
jgi:hypothetical protein